MRYRTSTIDDDILYSTNTPWDLGNTEIEQSVLDYALADSPATLNHSIQYPGTIQSALGFGYDDPVCLPPLLTSSGNVSDSILGSGNLESVSNIHVDDHTYFDSGNSHYDLSEFPFDDFLNLEPIFTPILAATDVDNAPSILTSSHNSLHISQSSSPFDLSLGSHEDEALDTGASMGSVASPTASSPPCPAIKVEISTSSNFKCPRCPKTFSCQSRYTSHVNIQCTFTCTYQGCDKIYKAEKSLRRHHQSVHLGIKFDCKYCEREFDRSYRHESHEKKCDPTAEKEKNTTTRKKRKRSEE